MTSKAELLAKINEGLPPDVDWVAGAQRYVEACFDKYNRPAIERYSLTKPLAALPPTDFARGLEEAVHYLQNFVNCLELLALPGHSRVLDVACGGGWFSHYMARMGYEPHGFDISADFIALTKRRFAEDKCLEIDPAVLDQRFFVLDIERESLPARLDGYFDAIVLESCLHHFFDPIAALEHLTRALKPDGLIVIIEGENRQGAIKPDYMQVMREFDTLERPYPRDLLQQALVMAGLPAFEHVAPVNGWYALRDPAVAHLGALHKARWDAMNLTICARNEAALDRVFPWRVAPTLPAGEPNAAPAAPPTPYRRLRRLAGRLLRKFGLRR